MATKYTLPIKISAELATLLNLGVVVGISKVDILSKIVQYIKTNKLQTRTGEFSPDENMKRIFHFTEDTVKIVHLQKYINQHIISF